MFNLCSSTWPKSQLRADWAVMGSILLADGVLGIVSGIDRSWRHVRYGRVAMAYASGKLMAGSVALMLTIIGLLI